jgi:putative ABC transport system permease protein
MIVAQAALLGIIGLIPGAIAGILIAYIISLSAFSILGHNIVFELRPLLILGSLLFGMLVVLIAALIPAERAARLKLSAAMHYE